MVYWNQPLCPSIRGSVYVSVCVQNTSDFFCHELCLQFCCECFENFYKHSSCTEVVQGVILNCLPLNMGIFINMYQIQVILFRNSSYCFAEIVLKICTIIGHILNFNTQFSSVHSPWFKNCLS